MGWSQGQAARRLAPLPISNHRSLYRTHEPLQFGERPTGSAQGAQLPEPVGIHRHDGGESGSDFYKELSLSPGISRWPRRIAISSVSLSLYQLEVRQGVADKSGCDI